MYGNMIIDDCGSELCTLLTCLMHDAGVGVYRYHWPTESSQHHYP